jgi:hypothetical protein
MPIRSCRSRSQDESLEGRDLGLETVDLHVGLDQAAFGRGGFDVGLLHHPVGLLKERGGQVVELGFDLKD